MKLFGRARPKSAVVLDVASDSIGGGYAVFESGKPPALCYTTRVALETREGEAREQALARALASVGDSLIREGAPACLRATGSGEASRILVAIGAPFSESSVRIERLEGEKGPFVFSESQITESLRPPKDIPSGKAFLGESVLATYLDGYESKKPIGEKAHRAAIVVLSTLVTETVAEPLRAALRALYHTHSVELAATTLALARGLATLFPHESDYLALRASGDTATVLLIRKGALVAAPQFPLGQDATAALFGAFAELARSQPLPHSVFILADDARQDALKGVFADARFAPLWLSDNPPRVLPVRGEHLTLGGALALVGDVRPDLPLGLITLFCAQTER